MLRIGVPHTTPGESQDSALGGYGSPYARMARRQSRQNALPESPSNLRKSTFDESQPPSPKLEDGMGEKVTTMTPKRTRRSSVSNRQEVVKLIIETPKDMMLDLLEEICTGDGVLASPPEERHTDRIKAAASVLQKVTVFARIPIERLLPVALTMQTRTFRSGEVICRQGEPSKAMMILVAGSALVYCDPRQGSALVANQRARQQSKSSRALRGAGVSDAAGDGSSAGAGEGAARGARDYGPQVGALQRGSVFGEVSPSTSQTTRRCATVVAGPEPCAVLTISLPDFVAHIKPYLPVPTEGSHSMVRAALLTAPAERSLSTKSLLRDAGSALVEDLFARFPRRAQGEVLPNMRLAYVPPGHVFYRAGDPGQKCFIIVEGSVMALGTPDPAGGEYGADNVAAARAGGRALKTVKAAMRLTQLGVQQGWGRRRESRCSDGEEPRRDAAAPLPSFDEAKARASRPSKSTGNVGSRPRRFLNSNEEVQLPGLNRPPGAPPGRHSADGGANPAGRALVDVTEIGFNATTSLGMSGVPEPLWMALGVPSYGGAACDTEHAKGSVRLGATDTAGQLLLRLGPGEMFGDTALLATRPAERLRGATVVAATPVEVLVIDHVAYKQVLEDARPLHEQMSRVDPVKLKEMALDALLKGHADRSPHDVAAIAKHLATTCPFMGGLSNDVAYPICRTATLVRIDAPLRLVCEENTPGDTFFAVMSGSLASHSRSGAVATGGRAVEYSRVTPFGSAALPGEDLDAPPRAGEEFSPLHERFRGKVEQRYGPVAGVLGPGGTFGEGSLLGGLPRQSTVVSLEPVKMVMLCRSALFDVIQSVPRLAMSDVQARVSLICRFCYGSPFHNVLQLAQQMVRVVVTPREVLARKGDASRHICFIASGSCAVLRTVPAPAEKFVKSIERVVVKLGPGDFFGEVGGEPETSTVVAGTDSVLFVLETDRAFRSLPREHLRRLQQLSVSRGHLRTSQAQRSGDGPERSLSRINSDVDSPSGTPKAAGSP